ncbi:MAG: xylulokinase [Planctomycetota bacterium]|nr:xylulokinase [Planctomycetota bacterium]
MPTHLLGIDVGTSGSKALLIDADGRVAASVTTEYPLSSPRPLWSEQDPHHWWNATVASIRGVLEQAGVAPSSIGAVGLTGQMHGLVLLDARGEVLRPAMLWNDQRTEAQCRAMHERTGLEQVIEYTGKPALPSFTAPKILWVREHEPEVFDAAAKMLLPKDYVRYRLTGAFFSDVADASGTSLFDVRKRSWCDEIIEALDVSRSWLPEVTESPVASAAISHAGAEATTLPAGTPVIAGAGDQAAEAVGCGIVEEGAVSVTIGTSGVVFAAMNEPRIDGEGKVHAYCHAVPGAWHLMGVMLSAGGSLQWYRDTFFETETRRARGAGIDPYDEILKPAANVRPGCEGLLFLPYLTGERTPHPDPYARGVFFGLTRRHTRAHTTRAVLEGVSFGLCDSVELMRGLGLDIRTVRASGGGARSALWRQILADVFRAEIVTVNTTQGAAYGAALLAGVGIDVFADVPEACRRAVQIADSTHPGDDADIYADYYAQYRALYPALADQFRAIARTDERHDGAD